MKKLRFVKITIIVLGLALAWLLGIDKSHFAENCGDCFLSRTILQYRIFTFPVYEKVFERKSPISMVAFDLGVQCEHGQLEHWQKQRWWGLLLRFSEGYPGITAMTWNEELYDDVSVAKLKALLKSNPGLPEEFRQRVLIEHDKTYWQELREQIFPRAM